MSRPTAVVPAVILATRPLGEADLLVVLLTPEHGKVRAAARHARKSTRRFAGGLTGGAVGRAALAPRPGSLWRMDGFVPIFDHSSVGRDLTRFAYVAYLCELTDVLLVEPDPDPRLFAALSVALDHTVGGTPDPAVLRWYELALLGALGLSPAWTECAVCGLQLAGHDDATAARGRSIRFDIRRGGALCSVHGAGAGDGDGDGISRPTPSWSSRTVEAACALSAATTPPRWAGGADDVPGPAVRKGLRDLLRELMRPHLRRSLRALEFFAQLPAVAPTDPPSGQ